MGDVTPMTPYDEFTRCPSLRNQYLKFSRPSLGCRHHVSELNSVSSLPRPFDPPCLNKENIGGCMIPTRDFQGILVSPKDPLQNDAEREYISLAKYQNFLSRRRRRLRVPQNKAEASVVCCVDCCCALLLLWAHCCRDDETSVV